MFTFPLAGNLKYMVDGLWCYKEKFTSMTHFGFPAAVSELDFGAVTPRWMQLPHLKN